MKVSKKVLLLLVMMLSFCMISYATEGEDIEFDDENDEIVYTDDYDDVAYDGSDEDDYGYSQEELKDYYEQITKSYEDNYNNFTPTKSIKAEIVEAGEPYEKYEVVDYSSIRRVVRQDLKVKIIEGDNLNKEVSLNVTLIGDSLGNIRYANYSKGDIVYVNESVDESGNLVVSITERDRLTPMIIIAVIVAILLIIYVGKKGFATILAVAGVVIISTYLIPFLGYQKEDLTLPTIFSVIAITLFMSFINFKLSKRAFQSAGISLFLTLIFTIIVSCMQMFTKTTGITFESMFSSNLIYVGSFDFSMFFYIVSSIAVSGIITYAVCNIIKQIDRESIDNFDEKVDNCKETISSAIIVGVVVLLALYIPCQLPLFTNKLPVNELINSESLVVEIVRILALIITLTLSAPICSLDIFKFGKKYLESPKGPETFGTQVDLEEEVNKEVEEVEEAVQEVVEEAEELEEEVIDTAEEVTEEVAEEVVEEVKETVEEVKETIEEKPKKKSSKKKNSK